MQLRKNSDNILTKEKSNQTFLTQRQNKKKRTACSPLFHRVIPKRFERLTHTLEGRCSIQLSYGTNLYA